MNLEQAKRLAETKMEEYGLIALGWRFTFDNAKRRFGVCKYNSKQIGLSMQLVALNEEEKVLNTILHEIAHALVGHIHGHDSIWKQKALEIGCDGNRCYDSNKVEKPKSKYIAICGTCGTEHRRHKVVKKGKRQSCGKCNRRFDERYILEWKINLAVS